MKDPYKVCPIMVYTYTIRTHVAKKNIFCPIAFGGIGDRFLFGAWRRKKKVFPSLETDSAFHREHLDPGVYNLMFLFLFFLRLFLHKKCEISYLDAAIAIFEQRKSITITF